MAHYAGLLHRVSYLDTRTVWNLISSLQYYDVDFELCCCTIWHIIQPNNIKRVETDADWVTYKVQRTFYSLIDGRTKHWCDGMSEFRRPLFGDYSTLYTLHQQLVEYITVLQSFLIQTNRTNKLNSALKISEKYGRKFIRSLYLAASLFSLHPDAICIIYVYSI